MSSRRLPGKVLTPLAGVPMLQRVIDRVGAARRVTKVVVATSIDASDDPVADYCAAIKQVCHRGSLENVSARFIQAAQAESADAFVRITGDSPLMDPAVVDRAVTLYQEGDWDLVTNVLVRSFPIGMSVEVLRLSSFEAAQADIVDPAQREHITQYYYAHPDRFRVEHFTSGTDASGIQLSVDTPEDFESVTALIAQSGGAPGGWRELAAMKKALA